MSPQKTDFHFDIGSYVQSFRGVYQWPGVVVSRYYKLNRASPRYTVECIDPEVRGALHIFKDTQLAPFDPPAHMRADRLPLISAKPTFRFDLGDPVVKMSGDYLWPGIIVSRYVKLDGASIRYDVECTGKGAEGAVHIFSENGLRLALDKLKG